MEKMEMNTRNRRMQLRERKIRTELVMYQRYSPGLDNTEDANGKEERPTQSRRKISKKLK